MSCSEESRFAFRTVSLLLIQKVLFTIFWTKDLYIIFRIFHFTLLALFNLTALFSGKNLRQCQQVRFLIFSSVSPIYLSSNYGRSTTFQSSAPPTLRRKLFFGCAPTCELSFFSSFFSSSSSSPANLTLYQPIVILFDLPFLVFEHLKFPHYYFNLRYYQSLVRCLFSKP